MSTPKPPESRIESPTFFIDRDLGRIAFPTGLRAAGLTVVTIAEHYGVTESESIVDDVWMHEAARNGWPVLCCDSKHRKRRRPAERRCSTAACVNVQLVRVEMLCGDVA